MTVREKIKMWRMKRYWKKYGRKDIFTWVYRYLRLHSELLKDSVYQDMFDYHRATLIAYMKRDHKGKKMNDEHYGELVDVLADIFNRSSPERVNSYKPIVDAIYKTWKKTPNMIKKYAFNTKNPT